MCSAPQISLTENTT